MFSAKMEAVPMLKSASEHYLSVATETSDSSRRNLSLYMLSDKYVAFGDNARSLVDVVYKIRDVLQNDNGQNQNADVYCFLSASRLRALVNEWGSMYEGGSIQVFYQNDSVSWEMISTVLTSVPEALVVSGTSDNDVGSSTFDNFPSFFNALRAFPTSLCSVSVAVRVAAIQSQRICYVAVSDSSVNLLQCGSFTDAEGFPALQSFLSSITIPNSLLLTLTGTKAENELDSIMFRIDNHSFSSLGDVEGEIEALHEALSTIGLSSSLVEESSVRFTVERASQIRALLFDRAARTFSSLTSSLRPAVGMLYALSSDLSLFTSAAETSPRHSFSEYQLDRFMALDEGALVALNVVPGPQDTEKSMSLRGLLGRTRTASGARRLSQWLNAPLRSLPEISARHDVVECFVGAPDLLDSLRSTLALCPAIDKFTRKIAKTVAEANSNAFESSTSSAAGILEIYGLYQFVSRLPSLVDILRQTVEAGCSDIPTPSKTLESTFTLPLSLAVESLAPFEQMVESVVDFDKIPRHEYMVKPSFDEVLRAIDDERGEIMHSMEQLRTRVDKDLDLGGNSVKLNHAGNLGYHFRVSRKDEKALRSKKNYVPLETRKDGVRFTCPEMKAFSRTYADLTKKYLKEQAAVEAKSVEVAGSFLSLVSRVSDLLASLDVLTAFAHVACHAEPAYVRPEMLPSSTGILSLSAARHPCLEVQAGVSFIANDVHLSRDGTSPSQSSTSNDGGRVQIVTGPNMGGKSTYIRTAGICAVMAQAGSFVPCSSARISILSSILARVGAGDAAHKGMSTFMKEMVEAASIVRAASPTSLVIIDELGRGTSTYDGFGLAWAIAEHLASSSVGSFSLFATHFHELTSLSSVSSTVRNKHVTASTGTGTITMLYEIKDGPCDRSFGIHVAELARFPGEVVARARAKAAELETFGQETASLLDQATAEGGIFSTQSDENASEEKEGTAKRRKLDHGSMDNSSQEHSQSSDEQIEIFLNSFVNVDLTSEHSIVSVQNMLSQSNEKRNTVV